MHESLRFFIKWSLPVLAGAGVAGCSGGGGGGGGGVISTPAPVVMPAPVVIPSPITPVTTNFDTAEYRRSNGAVAAQAIGAYQAGASGSGVVAAVIDSGVNAASAEFAGRISPFSRDLVGARGVTDEDGHGTSVSGTLLAARDAAGIHGVAFGATLLALRADAIGSCAAESGCSFSSTVIAQGFDAATAARARVINVSLGGGSAPLLLRNAVARAAAAGAVTVLSAGNEGNPEVDPFAASLQAAAPGTVIIAGGLDDTRLIGSYSNRAGAAAAFYLATLGTRVRSFDETGAGFLYTGTSEAAPIISGAVALLAQAFPDLTPTQIVDILLRSADDLGETGTDAVYGRGALNITRAFAPIGTLRVAGVAEPVGDAVTLLGSPLGSGDQIGMALAAVPVTDGYGRRYAVDLGAAMRRQAPGRLADALLGGDIRAAAGRYGTAELAIVARGIEGMAWRGDIATGVAPGDRPRGRFLGGQSRLPLAPGRALVLGYGQSAAAMLDNAAEMPAGVATLVTWRAGDQGAGFMPQGGGALAQRIGGWTLGAAYASSLRRGASGTASAGRATQMIVRADRRLGAAQVGLALMHNAEAGTLLGSLLSPVFGVRGAETTSVVASGLVPIGDWSIMVSGQYGLTRAVLTGGGLLVAAGPLSGTAASLAVSRAAPFVSDGRISLTVAQPLRVSGLVTLATGPDAVRFGATGREIAVEADYWLPVAAGSLGLGGFWRHQPGHIAASAPDAGVAARLNLRF